MKIVRQVENTMYTVTGTVGFDTAREARVRALEIMPDLKSMYSPDDGIFEIFYIEKGKAVFSDMRGNRREISL
ncbi:MAG: hypothetical protein LBE14_00375 [Treponema sp.]|jgi:uncharacterized pyridoxamine 5'-phosphate oxidase family protein|nr:hypothetical protein [Treponema sp.]